MAGSSSAVRQDLGHVPGVCQVFSREFESDVLSVQPLDAAWVLPFQDCSPVRALPSYKGQRNFTGLLWCATNSRLVGYESWLERDHLMCLDFAPDVVGIASQPFRLDFDLAGGRRWHVPDYFVRLGDGTGVVIDVRPDSRISAHDQEVFSVTESACASVGWAYRRVGALPRTYVSNLRWLAGYRHPRCLDPAWQPMSRRSVPACTMLRTASSAWQRLSETGLPSCRRCFICSGPGFWWLTCGPGRWSRILKCL